MPLVTPQGGRRIFFIDPLFSYAGLTPGVDKQTSSLRTTFHMSSGTANVSPTAGYLRSEFVFSMLSVVSEAPSGPNGALVRACVRVCLCVQASFLVFFRFWIPRFHRPFTLGLQLLGTELSGYCRHR